MHCPKCQSIRTKKNGFRRAKQSHRCNDCGYQFVESPTRKGYLPAIKQFCPKMYLNGMGFRGIARVINIDHRTIINWVSQVGK